VGPARVCIPDHSAEPGPPGLTASCGRLCVTVAIEVAVNRVTARRARGRRLKSRAALRPNRPGAGSPTMGGGG